MTVFGTEPKMGYTNIAYPKPQIDEQDIKEESDYFWYVEYKDTINTWCVAGIMDDLELPITKKRGF